MISFLLLKENENMFNNFFLSTIFCIGYIYFFIIIRGLELAITPNVKPTDLKFYPVKPTLILIAISYFLAVFITFSFQKQWLFGKVNPSDCQISTAAL